MEEFANEFHAVILDEDTGRDAVLVNQVINVLALNGFLFRGFFFVEQFRGMLLLDKDLHRVDEVPDAILIAA